MYSWSIVSNGHTSTRYNCNDLNCRQINTVLSKCEVLPTTAVFANWGVVSLTCKLFYNVVTAEFFISLAHACTWCTFVQWLWKLIMEAWYSKRNEAGLNLSASIYLQKTLRIRSLFPSRIMTQLYVVHNAHILHIIFLYRQLVHTYYYA